MIPKISGLEKTLSHLWCQTTKHCTYMMSEILLWTTNYFSKGINSASLSETKLLPQDKIYLKVPLQNTMKYLIITYKGTSCLLKYFPQPAEKQQLMLYKHTGSNQKVNEAAGLSLEEKNPLSLPAAWGPHPYHQPKQKMWNPTNQSCGPSTTNQANHSLLFFSFSELISESLTILNSSSKS